jgi:hypothetical protein
MAIWYVAWSFGKFLPVLVFGPRKIWQHWAAAEMTLSGRVTRLGDFFVLTIICLETFQKNTEVASILGYLILR